MAPCYREQSTVHLLGGGFTPNGEVMFERDGTEIFDREGKRIHADASGALFPQLTLPGLQAGRRQLTYVVTDRANPALTAQVSLLVSATDVGLSPQGGAPHRLLKVTASGFFGGRTLYAHVVRAGRRPGRARNLRIGRVAGPCKTVAARKRLFSRGTAPGRYRVQFDTFRRYQAKPRRPVRSIFNVTVFAAAGTARASALSPAS